MSYQKTANAHANRTITFSDGSQKSQYSRYETGTISGKYRDMPALIADEAGFDGLGFNTHVGSHDDNWHTINLFDSSHKYVDTVAIAGAMDIDHAITLAVSQFDHLGENGVDYGVLVANEAEFDGFDSMGWSSDTLSKLMNNPVHDSHYLPIITKKSLLAEQSRATADIVMWDGITLTSHKGDDTKLFLDLQKNDAFGELTSKFDMAQALAGMNIEMAGLDALMDTNNRLDMMKERIFTAMSKASMDGLSVTNATLTQPFKRQGVANVAMQFDLSDGQAIVIWFHNPDADPKNLKAGDMMVSWKWMLNKRDITAAVSPKNGENVQVPQLAMRMMKIAAKNSKRFAAAQVKKAQNAQALADAQKAVEDKTATLNQLDKDIADLNSQIEAMGKAVPETPVEPVANADISTKIQPNEATPTASKLKWYENQPDNVSVYFIGKSKGNDYLKVTNNGDTITALINIGGVGGEYEGDRVGLANWVKTRTQKMGGGSYDLKLVAGEDILADTSPNEPIVQQTEPTLQSLADELGATAEEMGGATQYVIRNGDNKDTLFAFYQVPESQTYFAYYSIGRDITDEIQSDYKNGIDYFIEKTKEFYKKYQDKLAGETEKHVNEQMAKDGQEISQKLATMFAKPDSNAKNSDFTSELEIFFERLSDEEESDDSTVLFDENRTAEEQGLSPIFNNKTVAYVKALKALNDIAIDKKYQIEFGDFSQSANGSLFDSMGVEGSYGITAQLMDSKGNVARAEIDEYGRIMILTGAGGTDSPHKKPLAYSSKKAIADNLDKAFTASSEKQADPVAKVAEPEPMSEPVKPSPEAFRTAMNQAIDEKLAAQNIASEITPNIVSSTVEEPVNETPTESTPTATTSPEQAKLDDMLKEQQFMKDVNKIVQSKKLSHEEKVTAIMALGSTKTVAEELATDDGTWHGSAGFKPFQLTNLNNRIKAQKQRVETAKKVDDINSSLGNEDMELAGVTIKLDKDDNRLRLYFPDKPSREIITVLKKSGFKWSPNAQAWQRQLTENAMKSARSVIEQYAEDEGIDMEESNPNTQNSEPIAENVAEHTTIPNPEVATVSEETNVAENTQSTQAHPNYNQEDIDYLNAIINGDIDPLDADMDKIIAIGEKDETDPLFEQALQFINDAEDKATAGV